MPRPDFLPTGLPSPAEVRERRYDFEWLHDQAEPRRPERNRGRSGLDRPGEQPEHDGQGERQDDVGER